jgi:3-hydroxymyristoyl/3-hydroxydecanoyl-(acyl carrier protein) dehydratase
MPGELSLSFAADHPAFAGHFPGQPIVPGVLLIDAALHAVAQARQVPGCQILSAKFLSPVKPGETLTLSWTGNGQGAIRFDIAGSGRPVATGSFVFEAAT